MILQANIWKNYLSQKQKLPYIYKKNLPLESFSFWLDENSTCDEVELTTEMTFLKATVVFFLLTSLLWKTHSQIKLEHLGKHEYVYLGN